MGEERPGQARPGKAKQAIDDDNQMDNRVGKVGRYLSSSSQLSLPRHNSKLRTA